MGQSHYGSSFQMVRRQDSQFILFQEDIGHKLERLYRIEYPQEINKRLRRPGWSSEYYYHGTGNCSCLNSRVLEPESRRGYSRPDSTPWCTNARCPIQGILQHGFLRSFTRCSGHFVSKYLQVAQLYACKKSPGRELLAIFICKIRKEHTNSTGDIFSVKSDTHIHPFYLALVWV